MADTISFSEVKQAVRNARKLRAAGQLSAALNAIESKANAAARNGRGPVNCLRVAFNNRD